MTGEPTFVDTNILLYAYDRSAGHKHSVARALLASLWQERTGVVSGQVLQEFYVNATRKLPRTLKPAIARSIVRRYAAWPVHLVEPRDIIEASTLEHRHTLSFWDALILVSAARSGAKRLVTEDMQDGRTLHGVRIEDPFGEPERDSTTRLTTS